MPEAPFKFKIWSLLAIPSLRFHHPQSAASKEEQKPSPDNAETPNPNRKEPVHEEKPVVILQQFPEKPRTAKAADVSEATLESMSVKELASQGSAPLAEEEVQQKLVPGEAGQFHMIRFVEVSQDLTAESYMMPLGPAPYNPYWGGMQPGMEGYMNPYVSPMPFMSYGMGPLDVPFGGMIPPDPFAAQGYMMPVVPRRGIAAEFGMGMNAGPPAMSREEFEARKADLRRRRENERRAEREFLEIGNLGENRCLLCFEAKFSNEIFLLLSGKKNGNIKLALHAKSIPQSLSGDPYLHNHHRPERSPPERSARNLEPLPPRPLKRKSDHERSDRDRDRDYDYDGYDQDRDRANGYHESSSVKVTSVSAGGGGKKNSSAAAMDYESSDDERHFKRKPSRYEPSPPPPAEWEEDAKHSRGSRERERDRDRKHR
ncbi:hypothetical protein GH714_009300 [Hevea brasiliensis]|uniref:DWNN domain-containing protein n=1 Tax=Hevea brasiliensis TaxID=3981 RepID=A0A6A6MM86_HEVBR|nr:hypothetical protein GH714_009300 [Hevea brasiliensis]